jgi:hypothetical protein
MRPLLAMVLIACGSGAERWPMRLELAPGSYATVTEEAAFLACEGSPRGGPAVTVMTARVAQAGDFVVAERDLVQVRGLGWIVARAPVPQAARQFLLGLGACVKVEPFADGDRLLVHTATETSVVKLSTRRVRVLDQRSATLEGCRMDAGRRQVECSLDLMWDDARFDADGRELTGNFTPWWVRSGSDGT